MASYFYSWSCWPSGVSVRTDAVAFVAPGHATKQMISIRQHMYRAGREEFRRSWILASVMSDLQRTRVHCFHAVLEENFASHLFFGCSGRLERNLGTNESLLVTREATPCGGNSGHKKSPSKPSQPKALPRRSGSMRIVGARQFFESRRGRGRQFTPDSEFRNRTTFPDCRKPATMPEPEEKDGGQKENNYRHQRRGRENKRRSISHGRGVQAYHHAAGKCRGHRWGRQPHGTLCNLTRVSI